MKRTLDADDIVIAEPSGPLALAGTMGGLESEIDDDSHSVAIEAVHFSAHAVARMSRRHKLSSEASRRFERGVDPELAGHRVGARRSAADRARGCHLRRHVPGRCGGPGRAGRDPCRPARADLRPGDLRRPGHQPARVGGRDARRSRAPSLVVTPPSWRPDLTDPADLVEEVVRLEGYENLPSTLPRGPRRLRPDQPASACAAASAAPWPHPAWSRS